VIAGYAHAAYAASLAAFGRPLALPRCGGWLLERALSHAEGHDAMGCYPLFACQDWRGLNSDLEELRGRLVSVVLVPDPFAPVDRETFSDWFDHARPFKPHHLVDLTRLERAQLPRHHRRQLARAERAVAVERGAEPERWLDAWCELYGGLARRHGLGGIRAFSRESFRRQFAVPGLALFATTAAEGLVGLHLWYRQGEVAFYHLGAMNDAGRRLSASYASFWQAMQRFRQEGVRWLDLGGGAGLAPSGEADGLERFKRGWAHETRMTLVCGKVLDRPRYAALCAAAPAGAADYFPLYRHGEFGPRVRAAAMGLPPD
jgi:hypothetical protein